MTIGIIGAGNMGTALCQGFISADVTLASDITVADRSSGNFDKLEELGVKTSENNEDVLKSEYILLAVKPQGFAELAQELAGKIPATSIVVSIMAGISIEKISSALKHQRIVRAMPNTPALVNEGVTGWFANDQIDEEEKATVQLMMASSGYAFEVKEEAQLDEVGTVSGSGPGFLYYIIEQWIEASKTLSLDPEVCQNILLKTLKGSLTLAESSDESLETLRQRVTSKGGITAEGLKVLESANLKNTFEEMLKDALRRTNELNS